MNIIFFGSSNYCLPLVETLFSSAKLAGIITHPDKKVGREQQATPSSTKQFAQKHSIPVFTPNSKEELIAMKNDFISLQPDIAVVADYGLIIPKEIFTIPKYKTVNIHFSRLPKYRGASPVQYTILNGERSAWITVQSLAEDLDTGDILWQKEVPLEGDETTGSLYPKLFEIASNYITDILKNYMDGKITPEKQDEQAATYTKKLTRGDGFVPWKRLQQNPQALERKVRAFSPWPGVWTLLKLKAQISRPKADQPMAENVKTQEKKLKILKVHIEKNTLIPEIVQLEGKKPVSWKQFLEGHGDVVNHSLQIVNCKL